LTGQKPFPHQEVEVEKEEPSVRTEVELGGMCSRR